MTISTQDNRIDYTANGVQTEFNYGFRVDDLVHMNVLIDGVVNATYPWSMDGLKDPAGGTVTFAPTPPPNLAIVTLYRFVPYTQDVDYRAYDAFPAETHELALDRLTMQTQQLDEEISRCLQAPIDYDPGTDLTLPPYDPGKFLMWDLVEPKLINDPLVYLNIDGSNAMIGNLNFGGLLGRNLASPVANTDAVNKAYVDGRVFSHSSLSGLSADDHIQYILHTGARSFSGQVAGIYPTQDAHLATKRYVDLSTGGGGAIHGELLGLIADDHPQYPPLTGVRQFIGTIGGVYPTANDHLATKEYVDDRGGVYIHADLTGLEADDHLQYSLLTGVRAFTGVVGGVTPTLAAHLATKGYIDALPHISVHAGLTGLDADDHLQYPLVSGARGFTGVVNGIYPTLAAHLVTREYVDNIDFDQYTLVDGTRPFTGPVGGVAPTDPSHLVTVQFVYDEIVLNSPHLVYGPRHTDINSTIPPTTRGLIAYNQALEFALEPRMNWMGGWMAGTYYIHDVVQDSGYLSIALTETTQRPAPQDTDPPYWYRDSIVAPPFTDNVQSASTLILGQRYSFPGAQTIVNARIWVPALAEGLDVSIWLVADPTGTARGTLLRPPETLGPEDVDKWLLANGGSIYIPPGQVFDLVMVFRSSEGDISETHTWDYQKANGDPLPGFIHHQTGVSPSVIRVHAQDQALVDHSALLDEIVIGSHIVNEATEYSWTVTLASKIGDVYHFDVVDPTRVTNGVSPMTFTYYSVVSVNYVENFNLFVADPLVDGINTIVWEPSNPAELDDSGYGIDIEIQDQIVSPDWQVILAPDSGTVAPPAPELVYWGEQGTTFRPVAPGQDIGMPAFEVGHLYQIGAHYFGATQQCGLLINGTEFHLINTIGSVSIRTGAVPLETVNFDVARNSNFFGNIHSRTDQRHYFGASNVNWITSTDIDLTIVSSNIIALIPSGGVGNSIFVESTAVYPTVTNLTTLGLSAQRFSNVFSVLGNFLGTVVGATPTDPTHLTTKGYVDGLPHVTAHSVLTGLGADDHTQYSLADGTKPFTGEVAGVTPTLAASLATRGYVDGLPHISVHSGLTGLEADDHVQYIKADGTRPFIAEVSGITPTVDASLATKGFTDAAIAAAIALIPPSVTDHSLLTNLAADDHTQYSLASGGRAFYAEVAGISPTLTASLATKGYVDLAAGIPPGTIMLFESDLVIAGWTLLTTLTDQVVFITSGSGAGGEVGGSAKAGGTWTQHNHILAETEIPSHLHTGSSHIHAATFTGAAMAAHGHTATFAGAAMAAHAHSVLAYTGDDAFGNPGIKKNDVSVTGAIPAATDAIAAGTPTGTVTVTAAAAGTPTGTVAITAGGTENTGVAGGGLGHSHGATWRPAGTNYTRQSKI